MASELNCYALILATGFSARAGKPTAFLPWKGESNLLSYQVLQWQQAGFQPWVVLGSDAKTAAEPYLQGARVLLDPDPQAGFSHSLGLALERMPADFRLLAISAVEYPRPAWVYHSLLEYHLRHRVLATVPVHRGCRGHPILVDGRLREKLLCLQEKDGGLQQVLQTLGKRVQEVELYTAEILLDYNKLTEGNAPPSSSDRDPSHEPPQA